MKDSVTPFTLSGNELIALLVNVVPNETLWSSLKVLGLLTDVENSESISDEFPPSEEVVIRGTKSLIERELLTSKDGVPSATIAAKTVALAFVNPHSVLSYQSSSESVEFTSIVIDTATGYRLIIDFIQGSGYEISIIAAEGGTLPDFFVTVASAIESTFGTFLFDTMYMTSTNDVISGMVACAPNAPTELIEAFDIDREGYWVITNDISMEGDEVKVFSVDGEEVPVFRRRFSDVSSALNNLRERFIAEDNEAAAELAEGLVATA